MSIRHGHGHLLGSLVLGVVLRLVHDVLEGGELCLVDLHSVDPLAVDDFFELADRVLVELETELLDLIGHTRH